MLNKNTYSLYVFGPFPPFSVQITMNCFMNAKASFLELMAPTGASFWLFPHILQLLFWSGLPRPAILMKKKKTISTNYMFSITSGWLLRACRKEDLPHSHCLLAEFAAQKPYLSKTQRLCFQRFHYSIFCHRQNLCLREKLGFFCSKNSFLIEKSTIFTSALMFSPHTDLISVGVTSTSCENLYAGDKEKVGV